MIRKNFGAGDVLFVSNLDEALRDLKKIDPDARKAYTKQTSAALKPYVTIAKGFIPSESPLSQWRTIIPTYTSPGWADDRKHRNVRGWQRWQWNSSEARSGIRIKRGYVKGNRSGWDNVIGMENDSISGKMFELIGQGRRRRDNRYAARNPRAGELMRENMNVKHGYRKRVVWRIKEEYGEAISQKLEHIIDPILDNFTRRG